MAANVLTYKSLLVYIFLALTFANAVFSNTAFGIVIQLLVIACLFVARKEFSHFYFDSYFRWIRLYFLWVGACMMRGLFLIENYTDSRIFLDNSIRLLCPLLIFPFINPAFTREFYQKWLKFVLIFTVLLFYWVAGGLSEFYMLPILFVILYSPLFKRKYFYFALVFLVFFSFNFYPDGRMQLLKGTATFVFCILVYKSKKLSERKYRLILKCSYGCLALAYVMILSNAYSMLNGKMDAEYTRTEDDKKGDTRSLLYYDVINSALKHNYWLWGRTPARGNDVEASQVLFIYVYDYDDSMIYRGQRANNEAAVLNYITHTGLIGLFLFSMIYFKATYLAVYCSRNKYIKLLGSYVAFQWVCTWLENVNNIDTLNVGLWCLVAMCYSPEFRGMNDSEFEGWFRGLVCFKMEENLKTEDEESNLS
ncbi:hypothetical protein SAMN04487902_101355 [Prevotella sp. ne3005]|uniref:hypothetical protein n=1 Tax=Prevotella sp. ne3005 TaxID=1761887 RepID=UPI0008B9C65E|nr:hypothetical protein [Prevotella sp. ne3005]SEM53696.1 hypothetical protein SAMN04487902_101355 [Prevotella sp. ne3005]